MKIIWALLFAFLVAFSATRVLAQDDYEDPVDEEPFDPDTPYHIDESDIRVQEVPVSSSEYVRTSILFPDSPEKKFVVADTKPIDLLVGFSNDGDVPLNVTGIQAFLVFPEDHRYFIQNYTRWIYGQIVPAGEEATFLYKYLPDAGLDVRDFDLTVFVFYHDAAGGFYQTVVYNSTVSFVDRADAVDGQTFFTYLLGLAVLSFAAYLGYKNFASTKKKTRTRKIETGTRSTVPTHENEWLQGTAAIKTSGRPQSPRRTTKNSNKA